MLTFRRKIRKRSCQGQFYSPGVFSRWLLNAFFIILIMSLGLYETQFARAQGDNGLIVLTPDDAAFPVLSTQIKPKRVPGKEPVDLDLEDVVVVENGQEVPVIALDKRRAGVHFTLAINGDRRFDVRDAAGESPYFRIQDVFKEWVEQRRFSPQDSLSLVTQEGAAIRNSIDRAAWVQTLENYQPNFRTMVPDLASLETALQLSAERVVPFGVDKVLLYITPPPTPEEVNHLLTLTEVARAAEIQVHVWMLGEDFFLNNDQGRALITLADFTGGQFFHYTGIETLPDPEAYLAGLGVYYELEFESGIREQGTYTITVLADTPLGELRGESGEFYLDVQPPKPIFLSPPSTITRTVPEGWEGEIENLIPTSSEIEFILEFPDHFPRELVSSQLLVDDHLVDERTEAPFESLTWDLTSLSEPGAYVLQVRVEDSLGLSGETIQTPVQVAWTLPELEPPISSQQVGLMIVGFLLAAAVILLMIWFARHFLQSAFARRMAKRIFDFKRKPAADGSSLADQPGTVYATLIPLAGPVDEWKHSVIQITQHHTSIGSDPERVNQVLAGADIDGLHARLRAGEGGFWLSDCRSAGGTWINYEPIGGEPVQLFPGDLIHFGATGFRFTMVEMDSLPSASVEKYDMNL